MLASYLAAAAALALLTVLPGPDLAVVTRSALAGGRPAGLRAAAGVVTGLAVWGVLTVAGLAAVLAASPVLYTAVRLAGAVFLVLLGVRALLRSRRPAAATGTPAPTAPVHRPGLGGLVTNLLNPKIALFYTSLLPALVPAGAPPRLWLPLLVTTHVALSLAWLGGWSAAVAGAGTVLEGPRVRPWGDRVTGAVLVGIGLRVAAGAR